MSGTIDYGIDLGTTNSSVAVCRAGEVKIFQTTDLMQVTPSVVYVSKGGRILVGKKAQDIWVQDPENTQSEFKRWMGYSDALEFPASGKTFSAEQLSAEVLKSLRDDVERHTQERLNAAVITVPAAFGSLQCDATAKAAKLAGFEQSPLLQEPIAAAIAYGASPASRNQRWMVFDLGGGTLDIAIVSTRNGRLCVLEHQGNNRLGGKDIDRLIAETFLLKPLAETFKLPDSKNDAQPFNRLMRALLRYAEHAKIALTTAQQVTVDIFDVGNDLDGTPIEAALTLTRADVESGIAPILDQCLELAHRAMAGARLSKADLDRVLLVGGPTQMPIVRTALADGLGVTIDHSLDPMTAVANGAALYASTIEKTTVSTLPTPAAQPAKAAGAFKLQLAAERTSGTAQSPVAGVIDAGANATEVKIDSAGGVWTSGWMPLHKNAFQVDVMLHSSKPVTHFTISARDKKGNPIAIEPSTFDITYMLPMGPPPLPHTMAIELSTTHGVMTFDPVFTRNCPLPAEARKTYKADRALRPSETDATLPIKFWEIDVSEDAQEKWWAGCIHVRADKIKRPIPEGAEMELTIKIDPSRKMSVELFIPLLNQSFTNDVYIPDPPNIRGQLQQQLDLCFDRLDHIRREIYEGDREELIGPYEQLQLRAEAIADQVESARQRADRDPDALLAPTQAIRALRMQLTQIEERFNISSNSSTLLRRLRWQVRYIERIVLENGTENEKLEFQRLHGQYERYATSDDTRGLNWVDEELWGLHYAVVKDQLWYWQNRLAWLKSPGRRFLNWNQATKCLAEADAASAKSDVNALRSACSRAFALQPPDQLEAAKEQESQSGLRGS